MSKLKELERRLKDEPDNLGLRVMFAGALLEAGRRHDAVEIYQSVAIAYREQGRSHQAIAVCRSILEIAPDDTRCHSLLSTLIASHKARTTQDTPSGAFGDDAVLEVKTPPPPRDRPASIPPAQLPRDKPPSIPPIVDPTSFTARAQTRPPLVSEQVPVLPRTLTPQAPALPQAVPLMPPLATVSPSLPRTPPPPPPPARSPTTPPPPGRSPTQPPPAGRSPTQPPAIAPSRGAGAVLAPRRRDTPLPGTLKANLTVPRRASASEAPAPRSSSRLDETPLPVPLPYHVADPTTRSLKKLSEVDVLRPTPDPDDDERDGLPVAEDAKTRPGDDDSKRRAEGSGLSNAARRISEALIKPSPQPDDLSLELDTRQRPRIETGELAKITPPPPTVPVERLDLEAALDDLDYLDDDAKTSPPITRNLRAVDEADIIDDHDDDDDGSVPTLTDEDQDEPTRPRDAPLDLLIRTENEGAFGTAFFQPLPAEHRRAVLARFHAKSVKKGTTVIRQGEIGHSLVVVLKGQLLARVDRKGGAVELGAVGTGEFVGEGSLLARAPSQVHVSALTDCELLLLVPRDFYEIAGAFPALWAELKDVAERRKRELESLTRRS